MPPYIETSGLQNVARISLGLAMTTAGIGHLTFARRPFQAQVPNWVPMDKDLVVLLSGIVELGFGLSLIFWKSQQIMVGTVLAIFFVLIFPGNIAQYLNHIDALGLDSERKRFIRLFFQPVLVLWALWSTAALEYILHSKG